MKISVTDAPSLAAVIRADRAPTTGFDYLRLGLAVAILLEHVLYITFGEAYNDMVAQSWFGPLPRMELGMFFALSGFLVAGSLTRNNVPRFFALRVLRIIPALAVEVAMTALVIGVLFTTASLPEYFRSPMFWDYFLNIVGDIHFPLPGVFDGVAINSQLWTIPIEFECYFMLIVFSLLGLVRAKNIFMITVLSAGLSLTIFAVQHDAVRSGPVMPGWALVLSFLSGVLVYLFKDQIPHNRVLALASLAVAFGVLEFPNLVFLAPFPIAYITIYVGLLRLPRIILGDLSYGIYLFHYPVLHSLHHMMGRVPVTVLLPPTLAVTGLIASLSWLCVEKPILRRKERWLLPLDRFLAGVARRISVVADA